MSQDALSEVLKIYPPLKLIFFVDDTAALVKGKKKEVAEMAKKVMKRLRAERVFTHGCCWLPPKFVGETDLGVHVALLGSDG